MGTPSEESILTLSVSAIKYAEFLQFQENKRFISNAYVNQTGNPIACISQSSSLGSWVLDSGASNHMSGNKNSFSSITFSDSLSTITLADGSQTKVKGIGQAKPLHTLSLNSVLFVPGCPFNLISVSKLTQTLPYSVTFVTNSVLVQEQSIGKLIGVGHEYRGLYYLTLPSTPVAYVASDPPALIHRRLGHPNLQKTTKDGAESFSCVVFRV
ncbi:hypothetical protein LguiA_020195 [Lonicera macranthoides]